jgi:triosephosphate isomerase
MMMFQALSLAALVSSSAAFAPSFVSRASSSGSALEMARRPFISGNWKLNPQTKQEAVALAKDIAATVTADSPDTDIALFVPYVFLESAMEAVGGKLEIGAEVSTVWIGCVGWYGGGSQWYS